MKLKESIPSNSLKIIDLYNKIDAGMLDTSPEFQRKLVWKKQHKYAFIETILLNYPFPEIYIASKEIDIKSLTAKEIVVDGQQRLNTIVDYIKGIKDFAEQTRVTPFDNLLIDEKKSFLNYLVTVKDLKDIGEDNIKEIFKRINSTDYSLNANEIINARYGDSEFAIFCKQLADYSYQVTSESTDVIIDDNTRHFVSIFLKENRVFSDNDVKRMFDAQYIMLITATILEGKYFGRSTKVDEYLEKYNEEFSDYEMVLGLIVKSIRLIKNLNFSIGSYWFNKANLFTLIVELSKINDVKKINLEKLELALLDLENKVDLYFSGDEEQSKLISPDETRYFEVARQGSHELSARQHRGKVIQELIKSIEIKEEESKRVECTKYQNESMLVKNIEVLKQHEIQFAKLIPTDTGLLKNIMDATSTVREFLKENQIHDYAKQLFGPQEKQKKIGAFIKDDFNELETEISLYRSNGRGDYRIWFSDLKNFATAKDELALLVTNGKIKVLNLTKIDYQNYVNTLK